MYPVDCKRPIKENYLLTGELEKQMNHIIAKIAGIKMCESYNNQYKTNLYTMPTTFGPMIIIIYKVLTLFLLFFEKYI